MVDEVKKKRGNPNWTKGQSGNPAGRVKNPEIQELRDALKLVKEKNDQSLLVSIVERAYRSDTLAVAILKKLLPDMTKAELETSGDIKVVITSYKDAGKGK